MRGGGDTGGRRWGHRWEEVGTQVGGGGDTGRSRWGHRWEVGGGGER